MRVSPGARGASDGEFGFLIPIALVTQALAIAGARVDRRAWRAHGLGGSYLALVTALLVVSWPIPLAWVLPATVGLPLIFHAAHGRRRWVLDAPEPALPDASAQV